MARKRRRGSGGHPARVAARRTKARRPRGYRPATKCERYIARAVLALQAPDGDHLAARERLDRLEEDGRAAFECTPDGIVFVLEEEDGGLVYSNVLPSAHVTVVGAGA